VLAESPCGEYLKSGTKAPEMMPESHTPERLRAAFARKSYNHTNQENQSRQKAPEMQQVMRKPIARRDVGWIGHQV